MNKTKRIGCLCLALLMALAGGTAVYGEGALTYADTFEEYADASAIVGGKIWAQQTNTDSALLELKEDNGNHYLSLTSSNTDTILLAQSSLFAAEQTKITFRLRSTTPTKQAANDLCPHVIVRIANTNRRMMDFGYSTLRYNNTALATGVTAGRWYDCEMTLTRSVDEAGKGKLDIAFTVAGGTGVRQELSFAAGKNAAVQLGLKIPPGNLNICMDDLQIYSMHPVAASLDAAGMTQKRINEPLRLSLDTAVLDDSTAVPSSIALNGDTSAIREMNALGDGIWELIPAGALLPNTAYTVTLPGIKSSDGASASPSAFTFRTRNSGLASSIEDDAFIIINHGAAQEDVYVLRPSYQNGAMTGISVEQLNLEAGASEEYIPAQAEPVLVVDSDMRPLEASSVLDSATQESSEAFGVTFSESEQRMTVAGKTAQAIEGQDIMIWALNPGCELDLADAGAAKQALQFAGITQTTAGGCFSTAFNLQGLSGTYQVFAASLEEQWEQPVYARSDKDIEIILQTINSAPSEAVLAQLFETYGEVLKIDFPAFDECEDKEAVFAGLADTLKEQPNGRYSAVADVARDVRELTVLQMLNTASSDQVLGLMEKYDAQVDIAILTTYKEWQSAADPLKIDSVKAAQAMNCTTMKSFRAALSRELLLQLIANSVQWAEVRDILEAYADILGLDMTEYNRANKPAYVAKQMIGVSYQNCEALKTAFDAYVKAYLKSNSSASSGSGSSGGSGSRKGGGGAVGFVPIADKAPEQTAKPDMTVPPEQPEVFSDLADAQWAADVILTLYKAGVINGFEDGSFRPNVPVSREEFLKMAMLAAEQSVGGEASGFTDVVSGEWYEPYVAAAAELEIVRGREDGSFGIGEAVTRQDAAVILFGVLNCVKQINIAGETVFADSGEIAEYARGAVSALSEMGIVNGMPGGIFAPDAFCTRAEAAKMIAGMMEVSA